MLIFQHPLKIKRKYAMNMYLPIETKCVTRCFLMMQLLVRVYDCGREVAILVFRVQNQYFGALNDTSTPGIELCTGFPHIFSPQIQAGFQHFFKDLALIFKHL